MPPERVGRAMHDVNEGRGSIQRAQMLDPFRCTARQARLPPEREHGRVDQYLEPGPVESKHEASRLRVVPGATKYRGRPHDWKIGATTQDTACISRQRSNYKRVAA